MEKRQIGQTGLMVDTLGLGGAPLGGNFVDLKDSEAADIVRAAQALGIGYFDTAPWYGFGRSERVMGDVLRGTDYVISDKVGRLLKPGAVADPRQFGMINPLPFNVIYDYSYDGIMRAFDDNLHRLGLDRVDIVLAHDIGVMQHGAENSRYMAELGQGGYRALDELRQSGQIKAIGIGVNEIEACLDVMEFGAWDVFLLAGRYTLLEQHALDTLFPACKAAGTSIICGGPFNSGILAGRDTWNYAKAPAEVVAKVEAIRAEADAHAIPLGAAALQFPLGSEIVSSVIPGPRSREELEQIVAWFETPVPTAFWTSLKDKGLMGGDVPVPAGES